MWTPESQRRDLERWRRKGGYDLEENRVSNITAQNPDRIFIDVTTSERYRLAPYAKPATPRITGNPPFDLNRTVTMVYVDGSSAGQYNQIEGENLEEEAPILENLLRYQADHLQETYNIRWTRFGRNSSLLLREFNPYIRDESFQRSLEFEAQFRNYYKRPRVFNFLDVYSDLRNQKAEIVSLWFRAMGYDLAFMASLAPVSQHFSEILRGDVVWRDALFYHYGQAAVRCMALGDYETDIHPWIKKVLDAVTLDREKKGKRYFKRLLELFTRWNRTLGLDEKLNEQGLVSRPKYPVRIWQCGTHIYGLFSKEWNDFSKRRRGTFLAYWNAETDIPLRSNKFDRLSFNMLGKGEVFEYLDHDQDGFLCQLNGQFAYVGATAPNVRKYFGLMQENRRPFDQNFTLVIMTAILPADGKYRRWLTPQFVYFARTLIPRYDNYRLGKVVYLEKDVRMVAIIDYDTILMEKTGAQKEFYKVQHALKHPRQDRTWRRIYDETEIRHYMENNQESKYSGLVQLISHLSEEGQLEWHDYSSFNQDAKWQCRRLVALNLTSAQLCDNCQWMPVASKCGHGCGQAQYCGQTCADAHYEEHNCPKK